MAMSSDMAQYGNSAESGTETGLQLERHPKHWRIKIALLL
jgi:hypothetical protein